MQIQTHRNTDAPTVFAQARRNDWYCCRSALNTLPSSINIQHTHHSHKQKESTRARQITLCSRRSTRCCTLAVVLSRTAPTRTHTHTRGTKPLPSRSARNATDEQAQIKNCETLFYKFVYIYFAGRAVVPVWL